MKSILFLSIATLIGCTNPPIETKAEEPISKMQTPVVKTECIEKAPIIVAVIDTGFGYQKHGRTAKLCKFGHKDFTSDQEFVNKADLDIEVNEKYPVPLDKEGHGTNIVGLIDKYAVGVNYCIVVIKYYSATTTTNNGDTTIKAIKYADDLKADFINYSAGGLEENKAETAALKKFLDRGGKVIAAAGNERSDIDNEKTGYFPARSDSRIFVVGNADKITQEEFDELKDQNKTKKTIYVNNKLAFPAHSSNFGYRVNRWEYGGAVEGFGVNMSGTSQATAIVTGKILFKQKCKKPVDSVSK